jgi:hypothetical protein
MRACLNTSALEKPTPFIERKDKPNEKRKLKKKERKNRNENWDVAARQVIIAIANFHLRAAVRARVRGRVKCSAGTRKDSRIMSFAKAL